MTDFNNVYKKSLEKWVTFPHYWELTLENNQQTDVKPLIEKS